MTIYLTKQVFKLDETHKEHLKRIVPVPKDVYGIVFVLAKEPENRDYLAIELKKEVK